MLKFSGAKYMLKDNCVPMCYSELAHILDAMSELDQVCACWIIMFYMVIYLSKNYSM